MPWVAQRVQNGLSFVHLTFAWLQASHDARSFCVLGGVAFVALVVGVGAEGLDMVEDGAVIKRRYSLKPISAGA